jgi:hypothetical protein
MLVVLAVCFGCSKTGASSSRLVGNWQSSRGKFTFAANGKFTSESTVKNPIFPESKVSMDGDYELSDGDSMLTITIRNINLSGVPQEMQAVTGTAFASIRDKPYPGRIVWKSNDEVELSGQRGTEIFKRVKDK